MLTSSKNDHEFADRLMQYLLRVAIEWIQKNMSPEDVFEIKELKSWAENNGYTSD
jgi:hypothetical protein